MELLTSAFELSQQKGASNSIPSSCDLRIWPVSSAGDGDFRTQDLAGEG